MFALISPEIIHSIAIRLQYNDLLNFCMSYLEVAKACNDKYFWTHKLNYDFTHFSDTGCLIPSNYIIKYWCKSNDDAKILYDRWKYWLNVAFVCNDLSLDAYKIQDSDIIIFRLDRGDYSNLYTLAEASTAYGNVQVLDKLYAMDPDIINLDLTSAMIYGHTNILDWAISHDISLKQELIDDLELYITNNNGSKVLDWLIAHKLIQSDEACNYAITHRMFFIMNYLAIHNLFPTNDISNNAVCEGEIDILHWLLKHNMYPEQEAVNMAAMDELIPTLNCLSAYDIFPDTLAANFVVEHELLPTLEWLLQHDIYPDQDIVNSLANNSDLDTWKLLAKYDILPDIDGFMLALDCSEIDKLDWLYEMHIYPDAPRIEYIIEKQECSQEVLDWLVKYEFVVKMYSC